MSVKKSLGGLALLLLIACGDNRVPEQFPDGPVPDTAHPLEVLYQRWNQGPELVVGTVGGAIAPVRKLEGGVVGAGQTALSPDRTKIAFVTFDYNMMAWAVIVRALEGADRKETVIAHTTFSASPQWSPDGKQLAYVSFLEAFMYGIYVVPSTGGAAKLVARVHVDSAEQSECIAPQWSPDGAELLYSTVYGLAAYQFATQKERPLVPLGDAFWTCAPKWSPDGSTIAFAWGDPGVGKIARIARAGGAVTALAPMDGGMGVGQVTWSPDGSRIAYVTFESEAVLRIVGSSGGPSRLLDTLNAGIAAGHPTFSPDSATVLYVRFENGARLTTVPAAGGEVRNLGLEGAYIGASYPIWLRP
jgi:WD40 repeat protein